MLHAAGIQVVTISFGTPFWVNAWLQETQSPFPMLLDADRRAYADYGLSSSVWRVWQPRVLFYYAKKVLQGKSLRPGRGDPHQLGGDFLMGADGRLRLVYYSDDPTDRPPLDSILQAAGQHDEQISRRPDYGA